MSTADAWSVTCTTCGWTTRAADRGVVARAGEVHERLKEGHAVPAPTLQYGGWVR